MRPQFYRNHSLTKAAMAAVLCGFFGCGLALHAESAPAFPRAVSSHFAIADFDGDRKPDLATVQTEGADSSAHMRYSIRFELTAGLPQTIGVTASAGGLQIVARDVNGDEMLDLLVSTEWLHQPVAILLNDGHGKFTLCDSAAAREFLCVFEESWNLPSIEFKDAAAVLSRSFAKDAALTAGVSAQQQSRGRPVSATSRRVVSSETFSSQGRAPPSFVSPA
jgi:hypothetical protein